MIHEYYYLYLPTYYAVPDGFPVKSQNIGTHWLAAELAERKAWPKQHLPTVAAATL